jgi:alanine-synthesizing transaminase
MSIIKKSAKLDNVLYDIRGPIPAQAQRLEEQGYHITKLHIGNPAPFGFNAPDEIIHDVIKNLAHSQGYCESKGLFSARKAVMQYYQQKHVKGIDIENIYLGNGVSELIVMSIQGLLNVGDEVLIPSPDYPLWTAAVNLSGGTPVHYVCDEGAEWYPDCADIEKKITPRTKGLVIINPNNPTGAVYPEEILEKCVDIARRHKLIVFADEIYDKILYDGARHVSVAALSEDVVCITFNGLSKAYRAAGLRGGWMVISGALARAADYIEGLTMLASMRLCSNVPAQFAIQTALGGYQSIDELLLPGGRLLEQRNFAHEQLCGIPGVSCVKPKGALYLFPKIDPKVCKIESDQDFVLRLLDTKHVLVVQGSGFSWPVPDHFRVVFLPSVSELKPALNKVASFIEEYAQSARKGRSIHEQRG